jgi:uncharacterized glyoxalase superfamily protein PhnB
MSSGKPIPEGAHTLTAHLVVRGARKAIEFYKEAFGATELTVMPAPDGEMIVHAALQIGDSHLMLCDEMPGMEICKAPESLGGTTFTLHIWTENADALFDRAVKAGAKATMPMMDAFWGDRYGKVLDPFGHEWSIATHQKDLTPEQMAKGAEEFFASQAGG